MMVSWSRIKLTRLLTNAVQGCNRNEISGVSWLTLKRYLRLSSAFESPRNESSINGNFERFIPATPGEVKNIKRSIKNFQQPANSKLLKVAILGSPNAGKSTIINRIMGWRVCSVSKKVHTTRLNSSAIYMHEDTQLVLFDTPGVVEVKKGLKHNLDVRMILEPEKCLTDVDLVAVIVDVSNKYACQSIDPEVLKLLKLYPDIHSILVLNKVDLLKSKNTLPQISMNLCGGVIGGLEHQTTSKFTKDKKFSDPESFLKSIDENNSSKENPEFKVDPGNWKKFSKVFLTSAVSGNGIDELKNYLLKEAKPETWLCNPNIVTNQSPFTLAKMTVRDKLLDHLPKEIPYNLDLKVLVWEIDEFDALKIIIQISVQRPQLVKFIIGKNGNKIGKIADEASQDLANTFRRDVHVKLDVVHYVKKNK